MHGATMKIIYRLANLQLFLSITRHSTIIQTWQMHDNISEVNSNYRDRKVTTSAHSTSITLLSLLFFFYRNIPGIPWVRTKDYEQMMQGNNTLRNDTYEHLIQLYVVYMGNFSGPE
jgi:hypothetical protein